MINKNRRIKQFCLAIGIVYLVIATWYLATAYIQPSLDLLSQQANSEKIIIKPATIEAHVASAPPIPFSCIPDKDCLKANEDITEIPEEANIHPLKKTENSNIFDFKKDMHQCRLEVDHQSVQQVTDILEQINYDTALTKSSYKISKYLTLNIISPTITFDFDEMLVNKIKLLLEKYEYAFGLYLAQDADINLVILPSKESYLEFIANLSLDIPSSQGVFWSRSNYAFVAFQDNKQAMQTAFHEAIHAINFSLIGLQPRWINEGLAEMYESMEITLEDAGYAVSFTHHKQNNEQPPLDYLDLVSSEQQWDTDDRFHLYASSRDFLRYLLDHQAGNTIIRNLLQAEKSDPCSILSEDRYIQVIEDELFYMDPSFEEWFSNEVMVTEEASLPLLH